MEKKYAITYDIGTTGVKCCVFALSDTVEILGYASAGYQLYVLEDGGVEQEPDEWWDAMCATTRIALKNAEIRPDQIAGISFCSQMQGLVLVDKEGKPVRRAMSYMDQRARDSVAYLFDHHYTWNTNLVLQVDSVHLMALPLKESFSTLYEGDRVVVADLDVHPNDTVDSVWVKLAHSQEVQGWLRESEMKGAFVPAENLTFICSVIRMCLILSSSVRCSWVFGWSVC